MPPKIIGNHIEKMDRQLPLTTKDQLQKLLKQWLETKGNTLGDLKGRKSSRVPLLWIKIENILYKINTDTKRKGILAYLENEEMKNPWVLIPTKRLGNLTKVTNHINGNPIPGFYMYKS